MFTNLKREFDTISHDILISKLSLFNFFLKTWKWHKIRETWTEVSGNKTIGVDVNTFSSLKAHHLSYHDL